MSSSSSRLRLLHEAPPPRAAQLPVRPPGPRPSGRHPEDGEAGAEGGPLLPADRRGVLLRTKGCCCTSCRCWLLSPGEIRLKDGLGCLGFQPPVLRCGAAPSLFVPHSWMISWTLPPSVPTFPAEDLPALRRFCFFSTVWSSGLQKLEWIKPKN